MPDPVVPNLTDARWSTEPPQVSTASDHVVWTSSARSDFWRDTGGVPAAHDGNALLVPVGGSGSSVGSGSSGDFDVEVSVAGEPNSAYDQFGLFVRIDERRWVKAGIELDDTLWLSVVATDGTSDWSRERFDRTQVRLRAERTAGTLRIYVHDAGWRMIRELTFDGPASVGVYSCSPKGDGFTSRTLP